MSNRLVGAWTLLASEFRRDDGHVAHPYGPNPRGLLVYDRSGCIAVQLYAAGRPRFQSDDLKAGSAEEARAAFHSALAYYGRYEYDEGAATVVHRIDNCTFPNWTGAVQRRAVAFDGDRLSLTTPPILAGNVAQVGVLVWARIVADAAC
jgi:hypothetical protein